VEKSGYADWLVRQGGQESDDRLENLRELLNAARAAEEAGTTLEQYMEHAALLAGIDLLGESGTGITMMTLHNAKGLEFPHVFIPGMEEGLLPHASSISEEEELEEERRLFYVGLTRARESVVLTGARGRRTRERFSWTLPSRFLGEIPPEIVANVDNPLSFPLPDDAPCEGVPPPERRYERAEETPYQYRERRQGNSPYKTGPGAIRHTGKVERVYERDEPDEEGRPRLGARVRHPKFGSGTVIQLSGAGDELMITVSFSRHGRKTLLAKMARLEPE
jgi:DNA helicase-2/ATP-dependent DNA helicase PcrA